VKKIRQEADSSDIKLWYKCV